MHAEPATTARRNFEQYFTRPNVGDLLIDQLTLPNASAIVELGAGQGSLLAAARRRWASARLTSVDIDTSLRRTHLEKTAHRHVVLNVLSPSFARSKRVRSDEFDAAVCNPPYLQTAWNSAYSGLLRQAGLKGASPIASTPVAADVVFLAHNLRLLRAGGQVGIIVPDGTVTGDRSRGLREALLENHALHSVIELPERTFKGTDAKTYILTVEKGSTRSGLIPIYSADHDARIGEPIFITPEEASVRMDHRFYQWQRQGGHQRSKRLGEFSGVEILRGTWNATRAKQAGLVVFHSTDIPPCRTKQRIALTNYQIPAVMQGAPAAIAGDIVLTRVGRHLEDKVARITSGRAVVSDCVYIVRAPAVTFRKLWYALNSPPGREWLAANARGVCAKVLNRSALLDFPIEDRPV